MVEMEAQINGCNILINDL